MDDMPMGDTDYGPEVWDVDRVRSVAEVVERRGDLLTTVAAVEESSGTIAAFTELVVPAAGKGDAQHYGTGVLPSIAGTASPAGSRPSRSARPATATPSSVGC